MLMAWELRTGDPKDLQFEPPPQLHKMTRYIPAGKNRGLPIPNHSKPKTHNSLWSRPRLRDIIHPVQLVSLDLLCHRSNHNIIRRRPDPSSLPPGRFRYCLHSLSPSPIRFHPYYNWSFAFNYWLPRPNLQLPYSLRGPNNTTVILRSLWTARHFP